MKFYYTYVLRCADGKLYVGFTHDLRTRLKVHLEGKVATTRVRLPVELVYYEACLSEAAAIARERQLKTGFGKAYLKRRLA
ncbi:MAG: GIY-YIG nuclease family protein [Prosthecobacter sp.]|uniref:GIY-YIG nuclease family protein n=1 Tax=Prosthecobacter sp. TaxID=1965333 RepID=UPI00390157C0